MSANPSIANGEESNRDLQQPVDRTSIARRTFDIAVASGLLVASAPALAVALVMVRIVDGTPVFYRGQRLGRGARPFTITKIRTLKPHAQSAVGSNLLSDRHGSLRTRCGYFLRETRLDELPQLVHVLRGDMALFGPRPERPEVYESRCRHIPGYADRFRVRPGLFGYSQILTPHGTPKRVRAIIDRRFVTSPRSLAFDSALLGLTLIALARETTVRVARFGDRFWQQKIARRYVEKRGATRIQLEPGRVLAHFEREPAPDDGSRLELEVADINDSSLRARGERIDEVRAGDRVLLQIRDTHDGSLHRARVRVTERSLRRSRTGPELVAHYEPLTENSTYVIEQYVMQRSIVRLPSALRGRASVLQSKGPGSKWPGSTRQG